jgi:prephenate dehydrogenase
VLGCGLVGASAAAGWSAAGREVWGYDRRDLAPLVERGWLARQVTLEALPEAAVVLLALPVGGILAALRRLPFRAGQLVTDAGSVKVAVAAAATALPPGVGFVGGHPLAGEARSGFEAARPDLFRGAAWALVPAAPRPAGGGARAGRAAAAGPDADRALAAAAALARELGAEPVVCGAEEHDRVLALTSHLPQLLATAVAAELEARDEPLAAALTGPGGRAFLRLAGSGFEVWRDILEHNRSEVERALEAVRGRAAQPPGSLDEDFAAAQRFAARLARKRRLAPSRWPSSADPSDSGGASRRRAPPKTGRT